MNKIKFVSFEGIDKSGKSTQAELLKERLKKLDKKVFLTFEPGGVNNFEHTRSILLEGDYQLDSISELFIFIADRREHVKKVIIPKLQDNYFIITDRYIDSTLAYQGGGRGIEEDTINYLNDIAVDNFIPAITFLIDISIEESRKRKGISDKIDSGNIEFMKNVRDKYLSIAEKSKRIVVIDGTKPVEEISDIIYNRIKEEYFL